MGENHHIDFSTVPLSQLTPEQERRLRERIIAQAHAARAQALRALLRVPLSLALRGAAAAVAAGRAFATWLERRRAIRELSALDDRTLRDIGLNRAEIEAAVEGGGPQRATGPVVPASLRKPRAAQRPVERVP